MKRVILEQQQSTVKKHKFLFYTIISFKCSPESKWEGVPYEIKEYRICCFNCLTCLQSDRILTILMQSLSLCCISNMENLYLIIHAK